MVFETNEVWAQGSAPGDPPISSVQVAVAPDVIVRRDATARVRTFARAPRPAANGPIQTLWDLAQALHMDES